MTRIIWNALFWGERILFALYFYERARREEAAFSPNQLYFQKEMTFLAPSWISFTHDEARSLRRERLRCMCLIQGSEKLQEYCLFWRFRENCQKRAESTSDCLFDARCRLIEYGTMLNKSQIHQGMCTRISIMILHQE